MSRGRVAQGLREEHGGFVHTRARRAWQQSSPNAAVSFVRHYSQPPREPQRNAVSHAADGRGLGEPGEVHGRALGTAGQHRGCFSCIRGDAWWRRHEAGPWGRSLLCNPRERYGRASALSPPAAPPASPALADALLLEGGFHLLQLWVQLLGCSATCPLFILWWAQSDANERCLSGWPLSDVPWRHRAILVLHRVKRML